MRVKGVLLTTSAILTAVFITITFVLRETPDINLYINEINNIVKMISDDWESIKTTNELSARLQNNAAASLDYTVICNNGNLIAATRSGLNETIHSAIRNRDTIVDIEVSGITVGKAIFYNDSVRIVRQNRAIYIFSSIILSITLLLIIFVYNLYLNLTLLRPFKKLQAHAGRIAAGNLDLPLEMDKHNFFGAFTESFDLLREELHKAKENERRSDQSKKELVASLSHDIKTPIASIKSATELMLFMTKDKEYIELLEGINAKAEQINALVTNLFHSALEELQALNVVTAEHHSTVIHELIKKVDYEKRVLPFIIPNCLIFADLMRLQEVFDNIISNSYKYAGTKIEIRTCIEDQYLVLDIIDFGMDVPKDELPLLFNKFYRGKNSDKKSGYGLGLYISKFLIEQMYGYIRCENCFEGFTIRLAFRLAG